MPLMLLMFPALLHKQATQYLHGALAPNPTQQPAKLVALGVHTHKPYLPGMQCVHGCIKRLLPRLPKVNLLNRDWGAHHGCEGVVGQREEARVGEDASAAEQGLARAPVPRRMWELEV